MVVIGRLDNYPIYYIPMFLPESTFFACNIDSVPNKDDISYIICHKVSNGREPTCQLAATPRINHTDLHRYAEALIAFRKFKAVDAQT